MCCESSEREQEARRQAHRIPELLRALECVLFAAGEPVAVPILAEVLEIEPTLVVELGDLLAEEYAHHGVQVERVAGGYQLVTRPEHAAVVARLRRPRKVRLSNAALETLAIIAYRQPITRPEIEAIRGVKADGVVETLLQYELIRELGRKPTPGRPMTYGTTEKFLTHFGLFSVAELPELPEIGEGGHDEPPPGEQA